MRFFILYTLVIFSSWFSALGGECDDAREKAKHALAGMADARRDLDNLFIECSFNGPSNKSVLKLTQSLQEIFKHVLIKSDLSPKVLITCTSSEALANYLKESEKRLSDGGRIFAICDEEAVRIGKSSLSDEEKDREFDKRFQKFSHDIGIIEE